MLFLELPTGGLADAVGRKPVLVVSVVVWMVATALLLVADTVLLLAIVSALMGVFRALDSGPLQAWFVDASLEADPHADLDRGLAHSDVVICTSIGGGALVGGFLASTSGVRGIDPLVCRWCRLVLQAVASSPSLLLVHEHREGDRLAGRAGVGARGPSVVSGAVQLISRSRVLTALVVAEFLWGFGMIAFEIFFPPRLVEVSANADRRHPPPRVLDHRRVGRCRRSARPCAPWLVAAVRRPGRGLRPAGRSTA